MNMLRQDISGLQVLGQAGHAFQDVFKAVARALVRRHDEDGDDYLKSRQKHRRAHGQRTREIGQPRILDARSERSLRRHMRGLLI